MISATDTILLLLVSIMAYIVRKDPVYKYPTWLLLAEFSIFIGFAGHIHTANIITDVVIMLTNVVFCAAFLIVGAIWLARLSGLIALFHAYIVLILGNIIDIDYYYAIMLIFAILQLFNIVLGAFDGFKEYRHRASSSRSRDDTKHYLTH